MVLEGGEPGRGMIVVTDTARGGAPSRLSTLAHGLRERGWTILFVSLMPEGEVAAEMRRDGFEVESLGISTGRDAISGLARWRALVKGFRPVVVQTALWHANVLGRVAMTGTGAPVINAYESVDLDKPRLRTLVDRATWRAAAAHVAVTGAVADVVSRRDGISRDRIQIIPIAKDWSRWSRSEISDDTRARLGIAPTSKVLGWSGRMHPVKNLQLLVRCLTALRGWTLLLIGEGPERARVEALSRELGVAGRVVSVGEVGDAAPYVAACDAFCMVSEWEGLPTSLMEAMALGLPVVAPNVGGIPDLVRHGETGLLFDRWEPAVIAETVTRAETMPSLGENAARDIRARYRLEDVVSAYEGLWLQVVARHGR